MFVPIHRARFILFGLVLLASCLLFLPTTAQTGEQAALFPLQVKDFPKVTSFLDVHEADGNFVHGLTVANLTLQENGRILPLDSLEELQPGAQLVIAISLGPALAIRDSEGVSRYDYLVQNLRDWEWDKTQAGQDDFSLVVSDGPEIDHMNDPAEILQVLLSFQPNAREAIPGLEVLSRAIDIAADPLPQEGMEKSVLFITPLQAKDASMGLQSLAARSSQEHIRIFVWLIASPGQIDSPEALLLKSVAEQTRGQFLAYTGSEEYPSPEDYLQNLRSIYSLSYTSAISTTGSYPVTVTVTQGDQQITTPAQNVSVTVAPPNPMFVSPPSEIVRSLVASEANESKLTASPPGTAPVLTPSEQQIEMLIEFPDGHERPITQASLHVDNQIVARNVTPPFKLLTWDISQITQSGNHLLHLEVIDSLGLTGKSAEIPIQVTVKNPKPGVKSIFNLRNFILLGVVILLSTAVLSLVLVIGGRISPHTFGQLRAVTVRPGRRIWTLRRRSTASAATRTVPAAPKASTPQPASWINRFQINQPRVEPNTAAFLTLVPEGEETVRDVPVSLPTVEVNFGRDPTQANWVIEHPSVEKLHARLSLEGASYRLFDADSIAGTWVNYTPVPKEGTILENGDLVHIGRVGFRFNLRNPDRTRKPTIIQHEHLYDPN